MMLLPSRSTLFPYTTLFRSSIWVSSLTVAIYVALGGLRSAIFNEVLQFILIWAGALLIPILGLIEAGGWTNLKLQIAHNASAQYTHLWSTMGSGIMSNLRSEEHTSELQLRF